MYSHQTCKLKINHMTNAQNLIVLLEDKDGLKVPPVLCTLKYVCNVVTCAF